LLPKIGVYPYLRSFRSLKIAVLPHTRFPAPPPCQEGSARKNPTYGWIGLIEIILSVLTLRLEAAFE
jgi:hypothetical protein